MSEPRILTAAEIDEIERREQAATPGPWRWEDWETPTTNYGEFTLVAPPETRYLASLVMDSDLGNPIISDEEHSISQDDRGFIAHARTDIPALIATVRHERERAEVAERLLERILPDLESVAEQLRVDGKDEGVLVVDGVLLPHFRELLAQHPKESVT